MQRIVEVPILLVDELVDFFHQKAVSGHEFGQIRRTDPAVGCVLMCVEQAKSLASNVLYDAK